MRRLYLSIFLHAFKSKFYKLPLFLLQMWEDKDLRSLVESDAQEVVKREETDSIAIIDDIRSHISASVKNLSDIEEAECRMLVVDRLLEELGLAA